MRFEDEPFIKVYTRDTVTWLRLEWDGQSVLTLLMRKLDRAGVLELSGASPVDAVAAVLRMPAAFVEGGLKKLFETRTLEHTDDTLVMPNYIEGQGARQSDKERKAEQRRRARDQARVGAGSDTGRHNSDNPPPPVTPGHTASHSVTLRLDETRLDEITSKPLSADAGASPTAVQTSAVVPEGQEQQQQPALPLLAIPPSPPPPPDIALQVFEYWRKVMGKNAATQFDAKRRRVVQKQLDAGRSGMDAFKAIDGCSLDDFSMGRDPVTRGKSYNSLELIFRDAEHVEKFMAYAAQPPASAPPPPRQRGKPFVPLTGTKEAFRNYDDSEGLKTLGIEFAPKPKEAQRG